MTSEDRKAAGAYYTPDAVVASLVRWAVREEGDRLLDPSCGDGRFLLHHRPSTGIEQDPVAARAARCRAPWAAVQNENFFVWATETQERFECAAGNPPFIRYQLFSGDVRRQALARCRELGAKFSGLTSSWAPFLVATASLLVPGGRMAFVVPAEIGHAPYASPLIEYLGANFDSVHVVAVRRKLFRELSEDCWLLLAEGCGGSTSHIRLTACDRFKFTAEPPGSYGIVPLSDWRTWKCRLRPFLLPSAIRSVYEQARADPRTVRLGDVAKVGIGYVTGDNAFFHLRPSEAERHGIPADFLKPAVRNGRSLIGRAITPAEVRAWISRDEPVMLLRIGKQQELPAAVCRYLDSAAGRRAKTSYKCRTRQPWYSVPDVHVPDAFLSYMSGKAAALVANEAGCVCTNSLNAVTLIADMGIDELQHRWDHPLVRLSCEVEGHPLGGGLLKIEPGEASSLVLPQPETTEALDVALVHEGIEQMRRWRHCAT